MKVLGLFRVSILTGAGSVIQRVLLSPSIRKDWFQVKSKFITDH